MSPEELSMYCQMHPLYSLPVGIRNARTKESLTVLEDCARGLSQRDRQILAAYVKETFSQGNVVVSSVVLDTIYAPLLENPNFEAEGLRKATTEFLGFASTPMTSDRHSYIKQFVERVATMPRQASPSPMVTAGALKR